MKPLRTSLALLLAPWLKPKAAPEWRITPKEFERRSARREAEIWAEGLNERQRAKQCKCGKR